jgi:hypothetical protein
LVLGTLLGARLVDGVVGAHPLPLSLRRTRAAAAKTWLSAVALPAAARAPIGRLIEATASDDRRALGDAWDAVSTLVAPTLDLPARTELRRLSAVLATEAA